MLMSWTWSRLAGKAIILAFAGNPAGSAATQALLAPYMPNPSMLRSLVLVLTLAACAAVAAPVKTQHVEAELVSERTAFVPGQATTVALRLKMAEGWHTYWQNPGDSGLPTAITWTLPAGVTAGAIQWPAPHALPAVAGCNAALWRDICWRRLYSSKASRHVAPPPPSLP